MEKIFAELENKVERVVSQIKKLKEENANLKSRNEELKETLRELERTGSAGDGVVKELRSRITRLEGERKSLLELRRQVEARLEAVLSQFDWFEE